MIVGHLDPVGGISGDMFLGALLGAGLDVAQLRTAVGGVLAHGGRISVEDVSVHGLPSTRCHVDVESREPHERTLRDIEDLLRSARLHDDDRDRAIRVFRRLASAEAVVHGAEESRVHFHEVGALDALIDVAGTVAGLRLLGIQMLTAGPLPIGHGTVRSAHGVLPNPAPATQELLRGLHVRPVDVDAELVTPTGAALVAELAASIDAAPSFRVTRTGTGAGSRTIAGWPNVARLLVGEAVSPDGAGDEIVVLRTTVDHVSGEIIGYAVEALFERGALDVFTTAVQMKKSRPGVLITVLCSSERWHDLADVLLRETGSLGARVTRERRVVVPRRVETVRTQWGDARVKVGAGSTPRAVPEYEDARRIARESGRPLRVVLEAITAAYETQRAHSS